MSSNPLEQIRAELDKVCAIGAQDDAGQAWRALTRISTILDKQASAEPAKPAGVSDALHALAEQFDGMSDAAYHDGEYDLSDAWRDAAAQARFKAKEAAEKARG